ncbi:hypothetical protein [Bacillus cereus]|nr:hypothetical protein [Bacillus cereus]
MHLHTKYYKVTGRRAKALPNRGIIQSLPSAGFGFLIMPQI